MKRRICYGCIVIIFIILIIYSVILLKRGIVLTEEHPLVQQLYEISHPGKDTLILNELYQENGFTNKYILAVAMKKHLEKKKEEAISQEELEKNIRAIFGNISFTHESFYLLVNNVCGYTYNREKQVYEPLTHCDDEPNQSYEQKIVSVHKIGNKIIIQEKTIFLVQDEEIYVYTSSNKEKLLAKVKKEQYNKEDYIDKGTTYEYIFTSINKNYIFTDIHIITE